MRRGPRKNHSHCCLQHESTQHFYCSKSSRFFCHETTKNRNDAPVDLSLYLSACLLPRNDEKLKRRHETTKYRNGAALYQRLIATRRRKIETTFCCTVCLLV